MPPNRLVLDNNPDGQLRCIDCGQPAYYMIKHDNMADVIKKEYYCEACCC